MEAKEVRFEVSSEILFALDQNVHEFTEQVRLLMALNFFKEHTLSFGKALELSGCSRERFLLALDQNEIDFIAYDPDELEEELTYF